MVTSLNVVADLAAERQVDIAHFGDVEFVGHDAVEAEAEREPKVDGLQRRGADGAHNLLRKSSAFRTHYCGLQRSSGLALRQSGKATKVACSASLACVGRADGRHNGKTVSFKRLHNPTTACLIERDYCAHVVLEGGRLTE